MKLIWRTAPKSNEKAELPIGILSFVIRDKAKQLFHMGELKDERSAFSIKAQFEEMLIALKKSGTKKSDIEMIVLYRTGSPATDEFLAECRRFGLAAKVKSIAEDSSQKLAYCSNTLEVWLSKDVAADDSSTTVPMHKIRVLIVEDSLPIQKILKKVYSSLPGVEIVGVESNPKAAAEKFNATQPDFVSLDLKLEGGTGLDFLSFVNFKEYSASSGARCAIVSDCSITEHELVSDALSRGATSYIQKPQLSNMEQFAAELGGLLTEDVDRHRKASRRAPYTKKAIVLDQFRLIAIGSSTGGTEVVSEIISGMPLQCPPIVIVQHMPREFTGPYADRIARESGRPVKEVREITRLKRNEAYLAGGDLHMVIESRGGEIYAKSNSGDPVNRFRPSVSVLFDSIVKAGLADRTIALILTGMGHDGAAEMLKLKRGGALTIGQSKESCVVYGMPRAAEQIGALCYQASPAEMIADMGGATKKSA